MSSRNKKKQGSSTKEDTKGKKCKSPDCQEKLDRIGAVAAKLEINNDRLLAVNKKLNAELEVERQAAAAELDVEQPELTIATREKRLAGLETRSAILQKLWTTERAANEERLAEFGKRWTSERATHERRLAELEAQLKKLTSERAAQEKQWATERATSKERLEKLTSERTEDRKEIFTLQNKLDGANTKIATLETDLATLQKERTEDRNRMNALDAKVAAIMAVIKVV
jgi:chromosome segregation ATPase